MSKHSSRGSAWEGLRRAVLERDAYICVYCGAEANEADHVIPKAQGGRDLLENLVAACKRCNGKKQDRVLLRNSGYNPRWLESL